MLTTVLIGIIVFLVIAFVSTQTELDNKKVECETYKDCFLHTVKKLERAKAERDAAEALIFEAKARIRDKARKSNEELDRELERIKHGA